MARHFMVAGGSFVYYLDDVSLDFWGRMPVYRVGGGSVVAGASGLAYTGAPVFAYAMAGALLVVIGVLAYRFSATRA